MRHLTLLLIIIIFSNFSFSQKNNLTPNFEKVTYDTNKIDVFKGYEKAKIKIDYYHTEGYSTNDRIWYEVIIIDSLIILNFESPKNDDWNYVSFQKQFIVDDSIVQNLMIKINNQKLKQIKKGIPIPDFTGYGANRLFIESKNLNISGGNIYSCVGEDTSEDLLKNQEKVDKEFSTSIRGDYEKVFEEILNLFPQLNFLIKEMGSEN